VSGRQADIERRRRCLLPSPKTGFRSNVARNGRVVPAGTFTDVQWQAIEKALKDVCIDIDAIPLGEEWWPLDYPDTIRKRPLRDALLEISCYYAVLATGIVSRLRRWEAHEPIRLAEALATLKPAHALLEASRDTYHHSGDDLALAADGPIPPALSALIDKLQARLAELQGKRKTTAQRSRENRTKVHREFWRDLARLWVGIGAARSRHKHVLLQNFLRACSAPTFRAATTKGELAAFTKEFFARPRRKPPA
jgi:hypothetical protein